MIKWLAIITTLCAVIGTSIAAWNWWKARPEKSANLVVEKSADLVATVSSGPYILPFIVEERFEELGKQDVLQKEIEKSQALVTIQDKDLREKIVAQISEHLSDYIWKRRYYVLEGTLGPGPTITGGLEKYWEIDIENRGSIVAKSVKLRLPRLAYAKVIRENYETKTDYLNVIELHGIQPLEKVSITVWQADRFGEDKFNLTHSQGIGKIIRE